MKTRVLGIVDRTQWLAFRAALRPDVDTDEHAREIGRILSDRDRRTALVCMDGEKAVGFVEVSRRDWAPGCDSSPVGYLEAIYVIPARRRAGVAHALVDAAERWARSRGCREMASGTPVDREVEATVHEQLGFERGETVVVFRKSIPVQMSVSAGAPQAAPASVPLQPATVAGTGGAGRVAHYGVLGGGVASFAFTDVWQGGVVSGVLLPLFDVCVIVYLLGWLVNSKYKRQTTGSNRGAELFGPESGGRSDRDR